MGPTVGFWDRLFFGVKLLAHEADQLGRTQRTKAHTAPTYAPYADGILLEARSAPEAATMIGMLREALQEKGLAPKEGTLELWSNNPPQNIWVGTRWPTVQRAWLFSRHLRPVSMRVQRTTAPSAHGPSAGR